MAATKKPSRKQPAARPKKKAPAKHKVKKGARSAAGGHSAGRHSVRLTLDAKNKRTWLRTNKDEKLRTLELTEHELIAKACELAPGYTPERIAREGLHMMARNIISTALSKDGRKATHGIRGSADDRLAIAVEKCKQAGLPITPARVGARAEPRANIRTAASYLERLGLWKPTK